MNTQQIYKILLSDSFVRRSPLIRVLARDQLPHHIDRTRTAVFIINTDASTNSGLHWVGLYYNGVGTFFYFDAFGLPILNSDIMTFVQTNSDRPLIYNTRHVQDCLSIACGLYAIYFMLIMCRGGTLRRVLQPFDSSHRQFVNDKIVARLLTPWLRKTSLNLSSL